MNSNINSNLDSLRILSTEKRERRLAMGLPAQMDPEERFCTKRTRQNAINANCYICVGGDVDPGWKDRIKECSVPCFLKDFRPYK